MSELRAPDPTLSSSAGPFQVDVYRPLPVAHLDVDVDPPSTSCGQSVEELDAVYWPGRNVAYIAVPCRECFPDAPIPGVRRGEDGVERGDPEHLGWQVT